MSFFGRLAIIKELIRKENINHSKNIEMKDIIKEKVIMPYTD